jgi:fused signal recognition particle receptor
MGIFDKGFKKTNLNFFQKLGRAIVGKSKVDDNVLDALEEALLSSDMGVDTTLKLIDNIEERVEKDKYVDMEELTAIIRDEIANLIGPDEGPVQPFDFSKKPYVMLVVGVNGVGKTTTAVNLAACLGMQVA